MLEEYNRHLLKALFEIDYVLEDMEFDNNKGKDYRNLKTIKDGILHLNKDMRVVYKSECEKWI